MGLTLEEQKSMIHQLARDRFENKHTVERQDVNDVISVCKVFCKDIDPHEMFEEILSIYTLSMDGSHSLLVSTTDHHRWFNVTTHQGTSRDIKWHFWEHYQAYLLAEKRYPRKIVDDIHYVTSDILAKLEDPVREGNWDRRGLVMGSVQSGKTGNYTGLIAKALDCGYKFIVVLTGIHNSLRAQTQIRINEELLGYDQAKVGVQKRDKVGVGRKNKDHKVIQCLTSSANNGDFNKQVVTRLRPILETPHVLVIKKHPRIVQNLIGWLQTYTSGQKKQIENIPLLVIDDECDQASINTKKIEIDEENDQAIGEATATNKQIRMLLNSFAKSAYVGYSATPFANIFIYPRSHKDYGQDLYPEDFIFSLSRPENYFGPEEYFGLKEDDPDHLEPYPLFRNVNDAELCFPPKHKKDLSVTNLPYSLKKQIKSFFLASTARMLRKTTNVHNSMLIHVTRFTDVQKQIKELVKREVYSLVGRINDSVDELLDLKEIWESDFFPTSLKMYEMGKVNKTHIFSWEELNSNLHIIARKIEVLTINGSSKDVLQYKHAEEEAEGKDRAWHDRGLHIIAIGGDKLSRGLTLEGLTCSYYLRSSSMYDTLMQMGRWFGYKSGYIDLCRIATTIEIMSNFQQIASAEKDLKEQFEYMVEIGASPKDFALTVQEDPGLLKVTNLSKRRATEFLDINFSGRCLETTKMFLKQSDHNLKTLSGLINECSSSATKFKSKNHHWKNVDKRVVCNFLSNYSGLCSGVRPTFVAEFIESQKREILREWDVVIVDLRTSKRRLECGNISFGAAERVCHFKSENELKIMKVLNKSDEWLDFTKEEIINLKSTFKSKFGGEMTGTFVRANRPNHRGLLIVYGFYDQRDHKGSLDSTKFNFGGEDEAPVIGFAVSFPKNENMIKKSYRANYNAQFTKED